MSSFNDPDAELQRREQELQERERALRLRELEAEIERQHIAQRAEAPLYETRKHNPPPTRRQRWQRKLVRIAQFGACALGAILIIRISTWLIQILLFVGLATFMYVLFFGKSSQSK